MPATSAELAFALQRPFAEQVAFFRGKLSNLVPTATWRDIMRSAHDTAFMVAGAAKADLLADLAAAVDKAIHDGEGIEAFRRRFGDIVQKHGWTGWTGSESKAGTAWRTRVIYRTNMATSYAAGRLSQLQHFPLWVYKHSGAEHPRLQHKAWNGLTLPADHEFWKTHYPPNGWGCGCRVVGASSEKGAARLGGKPGYTEPPPGWDVPDGKGRLPGIDEGWDYQPGRTSPVIQHLAEKTARLPAPLTDALKAEVLRYLHPSDIVRFQQQSKAREAMLREYLGKDYDSIRRAVKDIKDARLTLADKIAINAYTRSAWYERLNNALKEKDLGKATRYLQRHQAMIMALDAALEKLPAYRGEVRRGVKRTRQYDKFASLKPGDVLQFNQYMSTSYEGAEFGGSVKMVVKALTARKIDHLSEYPHEREAIIPRGTQFRVTGIERAAGSITVYLEEVPKAQRSDLLPKSYMRRRDGNAKLGL
jgi:hypothetical protein